MLIIVAQPKGLIESTKNKSKLTLEKIDKSFIQLSINEKKINFNSVSKLSGVSKTFLYKNEIIKEKINDYINAQNIKALNDVTLYDKVATEKDILIISQAKEIKELKDKMKKLNDKLEIVCGILYDSH